MVVIPMHSDDYNKIKLSIRLLAKIGGRPLDIKRIGKQVCLFALYDYAKAEGLCHSGLEVTRIDFRGMDLLDSIVRQVWPDSEGNFDYGLWWMNDDNKLQTFELKKKGDGFLSHDSCYDTIVSRFYFSYNFR